ncbi:hypothetical protein [Proteus cibi]|uniref:hypothetical protein n=1 Tax=Proteus cibi TaxID=2050966 RepID=UPI000D68E479|nr:hypothetical protein [Proteus cibi]
MQQHYEDKLARFILLLLIKQAGDLNEQTKAVVNKHYKDIVQDIAEMESVILCIPDRIGKTEQRQLEQAVRTRYGKGMPRVRIDCGVSGYQPKHEIKNPTPPPKKP